MRRLAALCVLMLPIVGMIVGCPPPERAVLAGTWELTSELVDVPTWLEFDSRGNLTQVITEPEPGVRVETRPLNAETNVIADTVSYKYYIPLEGDFSFRGTLNADQTIAGGELTKSVDLVVTTIIETRPATLKKAP